MGWRAKSPRSRRRGTSGFCLCGGPSLSASQQGFAGHFHLLAFGQLIIQAFEGKDFLGTREGVPSGADGLVGAQPWGAVIVLRFAGCPQVDGWKSIQSAKRRSKRSVSPSSLVHGPYSSAKRLQSFSRMTRLVSSIRCIKLFGCRSQGSGGAKHEPAPEKPYCMQRLPSEHLF